ncbi:hypothetical protein [Peredibacter starrii]|uniref:Uncharacterized protein n=1 Tax=Peredibacter starrii TaxID=28202 RepID=A0AAX4HRT9_9BACT|nr:hypothetical protein [Peredibacter starrii]WPU65951.1 hypothetical protein SOO65_04255 [Peredibacter starrii]
MKRLTCLLMAMLMITTTVFAQESESIDTSFSNPTSMTDEQMTKAKEFNHTGIKDRAYKEGCAKLDDCKADEDGLPLETIIGKAYALIFGGLVGGMGGPTLAMKKDGAAATAKTDVKPGGDVAAPAPAEGATKGTDAAKKDESRPDYCMYAAMAWETLGGFIQSDLQKKAEGKASGIGDVQLQSLISLKETHKARKTTATWQAGIYGAVSACYGAMAFTGVQTDWKYWAKLGGAVALTGLYVKKAAKHAKASKKVQEVIDSLPKTGECNPWTNTPCFCKELTSKDYFPAEYQEVCVLNNGNIETPKVALGCGTVTDGKVSYDKECKCKQTNSCMKSSLKAYNPNFDISKNFMNTSNAGFDLLGSGDFDQAKLDSYSTSAAALASGLKPKKGAVPSVSLNAEQKKIADSMAQHMPANIAALAAASGRSANPSGIQEASGKSASVSKLSPALKEKLGEALDVNYKVGGSGFGNSADEPEFSFSGLPGQAPAASNGTEVISFAEQAVSKADVSNAPETPIFDIISNRYRRSGWDKLQTLEK